VCWSWLVKYYYEHNTRANECESNQNVVSESNITVRDRRVPPELNWILLSPGLLRGVRLLWNRRFGTTYRSHFQRSRYAPPRTSWPLKMRPIGSPETSVLNYLPRWKNLIQLCVSFWVLNIVSQNMHPLDEVFSALTCSCASGGVPRTEHSSRHRVRINTTCHLHFAASYNRLTHNQQRLLLNTA
jgi:hypothetical protein